MLNRHLPVTQVFFQTTPVANSILFIVSRSLNVTISIQNTFQRTVLKRRNDGTQNTRLFGHRPGTRIGWACGIGCHETLKSKHYPNTQGPFHNVSRDTDHTCLSLSEHATLQGTFRVLGVIYIFEFVDEHVNTLVYICNTQPPPSPPMFSQR